MLQGGLAEGFAYQGGFVERRRRWRVVQAPGPFMAGGHALEGLTEVLEYLVQDIWCLKCGMHLGTVALGNVQIE